MTAIDPRIEENRRINEEIERLMSSMPPIYTLPPDVTRRARAEGRGPFPLPPRLDEVATDRTIPGRAGNSGLRVFVPDRVTGVLLHIHGGGWTLGANWQQDQALWQIAQRANVVVASIEYRLAPENPYPAAPDDCEDAALWLLDNAQREFGTSRLLVGGESAGAHLAVVTLLRLRDRHNIRGAFSGAVLTFGVYDLRMGPSVRRWGNRPLVLNRPVMEWFRDNFVPGADDVKLGDPDVSPLFADLADMPPAIFSVGTADPLLDDTLFMEARWRSAGQAAELHVLPEAPHGFTLFPTASAEEAQTAIVNFCRD